MTHTDQPSRGAPPVQAQTPTPRHTERTSTQRGVSPGVAQQIDENLRRLYRQQVEQELPDGLQALVARLRGRNGEDRE